MLERIAARRAELDVLEEQMVRQLAEVRAERDELVVGRPPRQLRAQFNGWSTTSAPAVSSATPTVTDLDHQ